MASFGLTVQAFDINTLMKELEQGDAYQRENASEQLSYYCGASAIPTLVKALRSSNPTFRADVVYTLARMPEYSWAELSSGRYLESSIDELTNALNDSHWKVRANAAFALRNIGFPAQLADEQLVNSLNDSDPRVRSAAAYALQKISPRPEKVVKALIKCLSDTDRDTRWAAIGALGSIGAPARDGVDGLINCLNDKSIWVQVAAAEALGSIGYDGDNVLNALRIALDKEDNRVVSFTTYAGGDDAELSYTIIHALGKLGEKAIPILRDIFISGKHYYNISYELIDIGEPAIPTLVEIMENCSDLQGRLEAGHALIRIGPSGISTLTDLAESSDPVLREAVVSSFSNLYGYNEKVVNLLCRLIKKDEDKWVRLAAITSLVELDFTYDGLSSLVDGFTYASKDSFSSVRVQAAKGFSRIIEFTVDSSLPVVLTLTSDGDPEVRKEAIAAMQGLVYNFDSLSDSQSSGIVSATTKVLSDSDTEVAKKAIETITYLCYTKRGIKESQPVVEKLIEIMNNNQLEKDAIRALGMFGTNASKALPKILQRMWAAEDDSTYTEEVAKIGGTSVVPEMIQTLNNKDSKIRTKAIWVLYHIGSDAKDAIPALESLLKTESNYTVRLWADMALQRIKSGSY